MSSGWGCQYLTTSKESKEWCRLLKHKCEPGCKGCILSRGSNSDEFVFSQENLPSHEEKREVKQRCRE